MSRVCFTNNAIFVVAGVFLAFASGASAKTFETNKISFRDITGAVEIVTTSGDEIDITIRQGKKYHRVNLSEKDGVVLVEGEQWRDDGDRNCCDTRINRQFYPREGRKLSTGPNVDHTLFAQYPTIVVSMPFKGDVEFIDARIKLNMDRLDGALSLDACYVYGEVGDVSQAVIGVIDGSRLVMGKVYAGLEIDVSGDADVMVGDAAMVDIDIAGPGDVILGEVDGMLDVSIAGSGVVRATGLDGPLTVRIAGSGGVAVKAGRADRLRATIDGSGGVYFDGEAVQPELRLFGSSEVKMRSVHGRIVHHGGGAVYVDGKRVE
jgi:Putative auto-transporter adhesin, head GIN domain